MTKLLESICKLTSYSCFTSSTVIGRVATRLTGFNNLLHDKSIVFKFKGKEYVLDNFNNEETACHQFNPKLGFNKYQLTFNYHLINRCIDIISLDNINNILDFKFLLNMFLNTFNAK